MRSIIRASRLLFALGALSISGASIGCGRAEAETVTAPPPTQVSVAPVVTRELRDWDEFTGRLEAAESVEIRPRVSGYVDSVHFVEGALVERGQLLFQIDPRPLRTEVTRLTAELERAQSGLDVAATEHARTKRLVEQRVISDQEFERLKGGAHASRAALAAASAALSAARLDLEFTRVRSPIKGRVSRALIRPGNLVSSASLLTTVVSVDPIMAYFDVDERSYLALGGASSASRRAGGSAQSPVFLGLMNEEGYPHQGRLDFLDNRLDPNSGTMQVRAVFSNLEGRFTPGLFARLKLVAEHGHPSVLIDERAVGTDLGKKFVLVVGPDQTLEYRVVTLGPPLGDLRVVERGLTGGDVIVVNGLSHVRAGMRVAPTQVAMSSGRQSLVQVASMAGTPEPSPTERQDQSTEGRLP